MTGRVGKLAAALVVGALAAVFAVTALAAPQRRPTAALSPLEHGVLADINAFRTSHHLQPLQISVQLDEAARQHTDEMAADGYFEHESHDGGAFWKRIQRYYASGQFRMWSVGENLLWASPGVSASRALTMWENSPEHRANLLTARWRDVGISAVHVTAAPGVFQGLDVTIVTTDFGVRG